MRLRKIRNGMNLRGKRVLLRIDANVPIKNGKAIDGPHGRIARAAVDLDWLSQRGAKVIVLSHLGRPNGKKLSAYSLKPVAKRLSGLLGARINIARSVIGKDVDVAVSKMKDGDILLLENVRFDPREEENAPSFAQALAKLADLYINDAFAVSHRAHTTLDAITSELPSYAGPLLANEIAVLSRLDRQIKKPFVLVMGGLKVHTKLPVMKRFASEVESILIGGALANTFLAAEGYSIGRSAFDKEGVNQARKLPKDVKKKLHMPIDVVVANSLRKDAKVEVRSVDDIQASDRIVDIGPKTVSSYIEKINIAKMVVWNGPFGYCEIDKFCTGTHKIAEAIADQTRNAVTIVGGGDTVPILEKANIADKFTLLSTGGGAMLEFLAGKKLPGLEALRLD